MAKAPALLRARLAARAKTDPRARARAMLAEIETLKRQIGASFYRMGLLLRELSKPALYHDSLGYASFGALLDDRQIMSRFAASKLVDIVTEFPAPQAQALGAAKAYALVRYAAAIDVPPAALARKDPPIDGTRLSDISVRALQEAAARARARKKPRPRDEAALAAERAGRRLRTWLRAKGARDAHIRLRWQKAAWWFRIDLPVAQIEGVTR